MYVFGSGRCGWRGGGWMRGLSLGFILWEQGECVSASWLLWRGWSRLGVGRGLGPEFGGVGWCYVCVGCESGLSV